MIKGMDISTLKEVEACGGKFYDQGEEKDLFKILKSYDVNKHLFCILENSLF
mgnify:CR=1 FL=1